MSPFVYLIAGAAATLVDASPSIRTSDGNVVISGTDLRFSETNSSISPISLVDRKRISSVPVTLGPRDHFRRDQSWTSNLPHMPTPDNQAGRFRTHLI